MESAKEFIEWLAMAGAIAGALTPFELALTQYAGKFVSGTAQLAMAGGIGVLFGVLGFFGFWGIPVSFYAGLQMLIFVAMCAGIPVGTYEAIKHAAYKGVDAAVEEEV